MPASIRRLLITFLVISTGALPMSGTAGAAMVPTGDAVAAGAAVGSMAATAHLARARLASVLARPELSAQLVGLGLAPEEAARRIAALDDSTAIEAATDLDRVPAGAGLAGIAVFVFALLILTDVMGLTRIFPFTRR